jgi:hypothetical protein
VSALGERAVQAQGNIADLETALEKTQRVLETAERVDLAAGELKRRSGRLKKVILVLTVIGITALVAKKLLGGRDSSPGNTDPYGASSTDT